MQTPLKSFIVSEIERDGPMDFGAYMDHVLGHPEHGYYMVRDPFGVDGDFTTAPEISQIFGEMIGVWAIDVWMRMGSPERFTLLECGAGRGTLMADILRVANKVPAFLAACRVCLIEMSPVLMAKQAEALDGFDVVWARDLEGVPKDAPVIAIGNEFLDALPVRQLQMLDGLWFERCIDVVEGQLSVVTRPAEQALIDVVPVDAKDVRFGDVVEVSPQRLAFIESLADVLARSGGAGIMIDYGHEASAAGDTVQALYKHTYVDVLDHIGAADVTAHVDFSVLMETLASSDFKPVSIVTQGQFLKSLGSDLRAAALVAGAKSAEQGASVQAGYDRLVGADQMGSLFKVMTFYKEAA